MSFLRTIATMGTLRWVRGGLALLFLTAGLVQHEPVALLIGAGLGLQALFNVGCCGATCVPPTRPDARSATNEVVREELE